MAITKAQALRCDEFHWEGDNGCVPVFGPKGADKTKIIRVRRNGSTQTWKTRPDEWRLPVKYGMRARDQFSITHREAHSYHTAEDCPLRQRTTEDGVNAKIQELAGAVADLAVGYAGRAK